MKPSIRKVDGRWTVSRPGYGFSPATVEPFDSWREAADSLRSAPASASASAERGSFTLQPLGQAGWPRRGTIRLEDS